MPSFLSSFRRRPPAPQPKLTVVVVSYNMRREIPRTLRSLSVPYQKSIKREEYEIILVDNGSEQPWTEQDFTDLNAGLRIVNLREAPSSPVPAVNRGIREARGELIGVLIDGARMVTPGLLDASRRAACLYPRPIIATLGFHLGFEHQAISIPKGYSREVEDRLLHSIDWPRDGYRLFDISVLNASCGWGWFRPIAESNALFMPAALWQELGGYDEAFQFPGGGLANLDLYERALSLPGTQPIMLLGEGNFHQVHGGIASNSPNSGWDAWHEEYRRIRGRDYKVPDAGTVCFGPVEGAALKHFDRSIRAAQQKTGDAASVYIELLNKLLLKETAAGRPQMDNVRFCVESVLNQGIPGDFVECGAWNGSACLFMRGILKAYGVGNRNVWVADSFREPELELPQAAISLDHAKSCFESLDLLDGQVRFLPGCFSETLPGSGIERISVLRLHAGLFDSTLDVLHRLYDKVSPGGFIVAEDYGRLPQCARAIDEFRLTRGIRAPIEPIDITGAFWRKEF